MKSFIFIIIVLVSGALAGAVHGVVNFALVEPYIDQAIVFENQNVFDAETLETRQFQEEQAEYRIWQKGGQILASVILGISVGALFGIVFALSRESLPGNNNLKKALLLAGVMWFVLYVIPFLKYPANPPAVGDSETVVLRSVLYLGFMAISGLAVVGFYQLSKRFSSDKRPIILVGYAVFVSLIFFIMPDNPDKATVPAKLINEFRLTSVIGVTSFWLSVGIFLGIFWNRLEPHKKMF